MTTPGSKEPPEGYTEAWNSTIWNVGHIFTWSDAFECWLLEGQCSVKPGQCLAEAYETWAEEPWTDHKNIFFVEGF